MFLNINFSYSHKKELGAGVSLYGNMKVRKGAYENKLDNTYVTNPTMTTYDVKTIYQATSSLTAEIGIKNLTDELIRYDMAISNGRTRIFCFFRV